MDISLEEAFQGASRVLQLQDRRRIEAKIPAGVDNGSKVHISPDGNQGGDFNLVVSVASHPKFQRQGRDLYVDVDLALDDAILGAETAVPTLTGQLALTVPPETPNGAASGCRGRVCRPWARVRRHPGATCTPP